MDQTLNAEMMDENNGTFKHDTEFHEFRTAVAAGADLLHARMVKEVTQNHDHQEKRHQRVRISKGQSE